MPRLPAGLHRPAQSARNTGGRSRRTGIVPQSAFVHQVRAPIGNGSVQGIVANNGTAILAIGPQGVGTRWYPSEVQLSTSTGPTDQSMCVLYRNFIAATQEVGQTAQGGLDTVAFTRDMQPGDILYAVWHRANPGDLATITVHGDQLALTSSPV
jgi:hypothetical protein